MTETDVLTSDIGDGETLSGAVATRSTGDRPFGASFGSLAFHAGYLAAGRGWHDWHGPVCDSTTRQAWIDLMETCS